MKKIAFLALLSVSLVAEAQKPVEVTVQHVNDRRTHGSFSQLNVGLALPKFKSSDVAAARVLVTSASDDAGNSLLDPEAAEPMLETNMRPTDGPATVSVTLKNPARKATKLKEVRGQIELYMPSKDPNSLAEVPKFLSQSGKAIAHKALKANGVEIAVMTPAQIAAEKKRRADAKRKELKDIGYEDGEDLDAMVASHVEYVLTLEESDLLVRIKDPNQRIQDIAYVDAAGEVKQLNVREEAEGYSVFATWQGTPQPEWKLRVSLKTPKNVVRHAFALTDVTLP